jgi:predicted RecB family nuclease
MLTQSPMKVVADSIRLSATDLANYLGCRHLTELDRAVATGRLPKPDWFDPSLAILAKRGALHEAEYVEFLRAQGLTVVSLHGKGQDATIDSMKHGVDVIVQATLSDGNWLGNADILLKVNEKSNLGDWSYEVKDTKLSQNTRAATILQLCLYTDLLSRIQEFIPRKMAVVKPGKDFPTEDFLYTDFRSYYDLIRRNFERTIESPPVDLYPEPVAHCDICRWWKRCDSQRHTDDHLSLIAGIRTLHRNELNRQGVNTLEEYARLSEPLRSKPERGNIESYRSIHHQAKVQLEGRVKGKLVYDLLATDPGRGLYRLPGPSKGDIYFDIEGDPFYDDGGIEYLLGVTFRTESGSVEYMGRWALDQLEEKKIFEDFIDFIMQRWSKNPSMYIYHYGIYEPAAVKRLTGRHGTRADEVDQLLRAERFIDLHAIIRESLKASVERYSLKDLEGFTDYKRKIDLPIASASRRALESALELKELSSVPKETLLLVQDYNEDDCRATEALHQWLEKLRVEAISNGVAIGRPEIKTGEATEGVQELQTRAAALFRDLTTNLSENRDVWTDAEKAKWLLAHLIEYFRREDKSAWWEYFRVHELDHDELLLERKALTGLKFQKQIFPGGKIKMPIHRYEYPPQETNLDEGDELFVVKGDKLGTVHAVQPEEYTIDIKKMAKTANVHPFAIHVKDRIEIRTLATSIMNLAASIIEDGIETEWPHRAAKHLLLKKKPRLLMSNGERLLNDGEDGVEGAIRLALNLDKSVLAIQGPPGSGKTYTGAKMIIALIRAGHKVGITAVSHKVIRNLFDKVIEFNRTENVVKGFVHKVSEKSEIVPDEITEVTKGADAIAAVQQGKVVGGTAWLWADDDSERVLDYLFIDEAGQMSLSLALAASRASNNLILLGDPQQLEQPQRGSHPEGSDVAALTYLLDRHKTIPSDKGLFLGVTRRLHPSICSFTSEVFYEGRLSPLPGLERQEIKSNGRFKGAGLFYEPVAHWGNQDKSIEEVVSIEGIVKELTSRDAVWIDADGNQRNLERDDILIVAPYNAQVSALREKLPDMRIGTVDKFQGQEAPVVIYSMTSSSAEDSPRGMSFLYNPNRLNVATSRAKCMCILVASPRIMEPECHTVEQMRWANALCRFRQLATSH